MSKLISCLFFCLVLVLHHGKAQVDDGIIGYSFPCVEAATGDVICLPLFVDDFEQISYAQIPVQWDETQLEFIEVTNEQFTGGIAVPNNETGTLRFLLQDATLSNPFTAEDNSVLFEVCFQVIASDPTTAAVEVEDITDVPPPFPLQTLDTDGYELPGKAKGGLLAINYKKVALCLNAPSIVIGEQACFALRTSHFINLQTIQFSLDYDPSKMMFMNGENFNEDIFFNEGSINVVELGNIRVSWNTPDGFGKTLENGATIADFCFDIVDDVDGETALTIGEKIPGGIEATNASNDLIAVEQNCTGLTNTFEFEKTLDFTIAPNPTSDQITIDFPASESFRFSVLDGKGHTKIAWREASENHISIDVETLASGIYFLRIEQGSTRGIQKFVKL